MTVDVAISLCFARIFSNAAVNIFSSAQSAAWAFHTSWSKCNVCVCVWMLTRAAQVVTAAHRDLWSCMHRPTKDLWSQTKNKVALTYFTDHASPPQKSGRGWAFSSQLSFTACGLLVLYLCNLYSVKHEDVCHVVCMLLLSGECYLPAFT